MKGDIERRGEPYFGGISRSTQYIHGHCYAKVDNRDWIDELLEISTVRLPLNWYFVPGTGKDELFGTVVMPNNIESDMMLATLAERHSLIFVGNYEYISFNRKYSENRITYMTYAIRNTVIPSHFSDEKRKEFIRNKALRAFSAIH
ncbi:hypothetical protein [Desulfonatronospira thiodismutans]|uniref:hypothetical protein n=1 Tax=Desulfonatronospira thiodismutans TaxID=488939 RepID=UPI001375C045|nr:hypothetical protein [Desulfonatronospira thiodismutans]